MRITKTVREQSGVIPYKIEDGEMKVLLVRASSDKEWTVPKGGVEENMTRKASAAKEALEEAGAIGEVGNRIGSFVYNKRGKTQLVDVYPMLVTKTVEVYLESKIRKRKWFSAADALEKLHVSSKSQLAIHLRKLVNNLKSN